MPDFYLKQGDRLPVMAATLTTSDGSAIDLTAATVNFIYQASDGLTAAVVGAGTVTITDATAGEVEYAWSAADAALDAGTYNAEFEAQIGGLRITAPNNGYIEFEVVADLEDA